MEVEALVAACDVLVRRALELVGKRTMTGSMRRPKPDWPTVYLNHMIDPEKLQRSLLDAWELIPHVVAAHGCCGITSTELELTLTSYVIDIVIEPRPHTTEELADRLAMHSLVL
jgi:hypothetical protein